MKLYFLILAAFVSAGAFSVPNQICVRNYLKGTTGFNPCEEGFGYSYAVPAPGVIGQVCTRAYHAFHCEVASDEYVRLRSPDGKEFCTVDFNQPTVSNYCKTAEAYYDYVVYQVSN